MMKNIIKRLVSGAVVGVMAMTSFSTLCLADTNAEVKAILGDNYNKLLQNGYIAESSSNVPTIAGTSGIIESVDTLGTNVILVTLDGYYPNFNINDISLKAYNSEWYAFKASLKDRITVKDSAVTINKEGKTVIIYSIEQSIDGNRLENDYAVSTVDDKDAAVTLADNYVSWQMDHGGWDKGVSLQASRPWDGVEAKNVSSGWTSTDGVPLGTIDNSSTYTQMRAIAQAYQLTGDSKYKTSIEKGLDFLQLVQYPSGGFAQVYPKRGNYSDYVTYNDDAMANVLIMLEDIKDKNYPFDGDLISDKYYSEVCDSIDLAIDYILKSQIESQGVKTAWCAQHDPVTYEAKGGRAYEHPSISGSESIGVLKFLMHQEQTPEIKEAVDSAIAWLRSSAVNDTAYVNKPATADGHFVYSAGSTIWYRFYEIGTNKAIFSGRDGIVRYDIAEVEQERREGYAWAGTWANKLLTTLDTYGYYPNKICAVVANTNSVDVNGVKLEKGYTAEAENDNLENLKVSDYMYGDADSDGVLTSADAAYILQHSLNTSAGVIASDILAYVDVDGDGLVSANDAAEVLAKVLNLEYVYSKDK